MMYFPKLSINIAISPRGHYNGTLQILLSQFKCFVYPPPGVNFPLSTVTTFEPEMKDWTRFDTKLYGKIHFTFQKEIDCLNSHNKSIFGL